MPDLIKEKWAKILQKQERIPLNNFDLTSKGEKSIRKVQSSVSLKKLALKTWKKFILLQQSKNKLKRSQSIPLINSF